MLNYILLSILLLFSLDSFAVKTIKDIYFFQVPIFKYSMEKGCVDSRIKKKIDAKKSKLFCGCMLDTLSKNISDIDWKRIVLAAQYEKKTIQEIPQILNAIPFVEPCNKYLE